MIFSKRTLPNALQALRRFVSRLWRRDQPVLVEPEEQNRRLSLCRSCPRLSGSQCAVCTCFVEVKTLLTTERCPLGKW